MPMVKCGSEAWALRKTDKDLLDVFLRNCLRIVLGSLLIESMSNSRLCEKCRSNPLSKAIVRETLKKICTQNFLQAQFFGHIFYGHRIFGTQNSLPIIFGLFLENPEIFGLVNLFFVCIIFCVAAQCLAIYTT